jgi:hypothetical protein
MWHADHLFPSVSTSCILRMYPMQVYVFNLCRQSDGNWRFLWMLQTAFVARFVETAKIARPSSPPVRHDSTTLSGHLSFGLSSRTSVSPEQCTVSGCFWGAALSVKDKRVSSRKVRVCWCVLRDRQVQTPSVRHTVSVWPSPQHRTPRSSAVEYGSLFTVSLACLASMLRLLFSSRRLMQSGNYTYRLM